MSSLTAKEGALSFRATFTLTACILFFVDVAGIWLWTASDGEVALVEKFGGDFFRIAALALLVLSFNKKQITIASRLPLIFFILSLYMLLSAIFSPKYEYAILQYIRFLAILFMFTAISAYQFEKEFDKGIERVFLLTLIGSLILAIIAPSLAVMHSAGLDGSVRGLFTHKNIFASFSVLTFAWLLTSSALSSRRKMLLFLLTALSITSARSATSIVLLAVVIFSYFFSSRLIINRNKILILPTILIASALFAFAISYAEVVFSLLGRDATLTGRTEFWSYLLNVHRQQPVFGYGYNSIMEYEEIVAPLREFVYTKFTSSHNSYLDIILNLGWLGFFLFLALIVYSLWRAIKQASNTNYNVSVRFLVITAVFLVLGITESNAGLSNRLATMLYFGALIQLFNYSPPPP
ncbi:O-antigen ligase family protein [Pannonibacter phragmitetus]|uniref:O-antigen ligase family protein n=1 Tax=Pannonibacter phragmitetus TaxID=121719 RepID=UPI000F447848|nr:O-antigen ligase family protein [Pannonibacter phragmitetus]